MLRGEPRFEDVFGRPPSIVARSPGRVNLIGEHVDYQDGLVLPAAIDLYITAEAAPNRENMLRLWSAASPDVPPLSMPLDRLAPARGRGAWTNYAAGVVAGYRAAGVPVSGIDIAFSTTLPPGAGMSSSAALEAATALVIEALSGVEKFPPARALLCQAAEHAFAGVPCGIMDQLAVNCGVAGHALLIDCRSLAVSPAPLPAGISIVVADTGVRHALADGEYGRRKADCEAACSVLGAATLRDVTPPDIEAAGDALCGTGFRRARHVVSEIARVRQFTEALQHDDLARMGALMAASHASLRDDYEVSCRELDTLVELATSTGVIGARMMGGGFGGSTINLVHEGEAEAIAAALCRRYREATGCGIRAFVVHAVDGAAVLPLAQPRSEEPDASARAS